MIFMIFLRNMHINLYEMFFPLISGNSKIVSSTANSATSLLNIELL